MSALYTCAAGHEQTFEDYRATLHSLIGFPCLLRIRDASGAVVAVCVAKFTAKEIG